MTTLMPGKYQFTYNIGNGDVRVYDIYSDGHIEERKSRTNDVNPVTTQHTLERLDKMIALRKREWNQLKNAPIYGIVAKTQLTILTTIRKFITDNPVTEEDIGYL
jgi:hypothetical protein